MSANNNAHFAAPPVECLNEHLNYFNDTIAGQPSMMDGDFDAIFSADFDLVFDPMLMMNSDAATVARPVNINSQPAPMPQPVPSSYAAKPTTTYMPPPPAAAHQPVIKAPIRKWVAPQVSPTSVTAVFESIPAPPSPAPPAPVAKSSPRKRSYSMVSAPKPVTVTSAPAASEPEEPAVDTSNMSFQEQEDLRRERNRHHAKRSRQRKRNYMTQLEEAVNEMRKENERLFDLLGMDSRRAKADMAQEEERKAAVATDKFIAGLKQPRNRVLDNTTLAFLRELWK